MIRHEIQLDGQADLEAKIPSFVEVIGKFGQDIAANDLVVARLILAPDQDLCVEFAPGLEQEAIESKLKDAIEEYAKALAAVRPVVLPAEPVEKPVEQPAEPTEVAEVIEQEPVAEEAETKKGRKK